MSDVDDQKVLDNPDSVKSELEITQDRAVSDYNQQPGKLSMAVKVHSPFHDYYDGPAFSVSAENATGPFDILPKHHNFISLLLPCDMIIRTVAKGEQKIRISGGIMHVKADELIVFLDV
jgi:F0F1-type ATP synthase epsilon subunit